ncbi:MAG: stage V sporulation protein AD, partial [bacterium]
VGKQTIALTRGVYLLDWSSTVGKKEGEGPLGGGFEEIEPDALFGQESWEKAESELVRRTVTRLLIRSGGAEALFGGDLLAQMSATHFGLRGLELPLLGVYGACSTMAEALLVAALCVEGGGFGRAVAVTSSHFAGAEREFRAPMEYGGQRTPTAQWTVTGCGAALLTAEKSPVRITRVTPGIITDAGVKDAANMGAAMAPAALSTILAHLTDTASAPGDYDLILTGDLGYHGSELLRELFRREGITLGEGYQDCGARMYDREGQDVHAGGSGCGCSASILCGHILPGLRDGRWRRVLFCATGALLSPVTALQGESIPGICHAVELVRED